MDYLKINISIVLLAMLCGCGNQEKSEENLTKIHVPEDFSTISEAVDAAVNNQIIVVSGGDYSGNISIINKSLSIWGVNLPTISCENSGENGLNIFEADGTSIDGIKIENCEDGISTDSVINITNSIFFRNVDGIDYEGGGGVAQGNRFSFNLDDGLDLDRDVSVKIISNIISNNDDDGIEIRLHPRTEVARSTIIIEENEIDNNGEVGVQLIDYEEETGRVLYITRNSFNNNRLANLTIMDNENTLEDLSGGSILDPIFIYNNNFIGSNIAVSASGEGVIFLNNIVYAPNLYFSNDGLMVNSSNAIWGGKNQFNTDLLAKDPHFEVKEYKISSNSPLIDAGIQGFSYNNIELLIPFKGRGVDIGRHELK